MSLCGLASGCELANSAQENLLFEVAANDGTTRSSGMPASAKLGCNPGDIHAARETTHADTPAALICIENRGRVCALGADEEVHESFCLTWLSLAGRKDFFCQFCPDQSARPLHAVKSSLPEANGRFRFEAEKRVDDWDRICTRVDKIRGRSHGPRRRRVRAQAKRVAVNAREQALRDLHIEAGPPEFQ